MALITTIDELKKYIALEDNVNIKTLQPFIDEAELLYIVDLLGSAFYTEFLAAYNASIATSSPTPLSDDNKALLPYIQRCLANYMMLQAIPQLATTVGDMGIRQYNGENSSAAPQWQQEKVLFNYIKSGDLHAEKLLEYLEANATSSKYATWFNSTANTKNAGYLVRSAIIATKFIDISQSRRIFLKLRQKFQELETRYAAKWVGDAQYTEFQNQIKAGTVTAENQKLIDRITAIICKMGLHIQLPFIRISIQSDGLWLYSEAAMTLRDRWFMAEHEQIEDLRCALKDGELGYVKDQESLRQFILGNIDTYPLIKATSIYTVQPDTDIWQPPANHERNKHFVV